MRIFAFHLLNDYSGSPKVLMQLTKGWIAKGHDVHIVTCPGRDGFLSNIEGAKYLYFWYQWAANPFRRLLHLSTSQLILVLKFLFIVKKDDIIYINTVLPFGAAFLGKLKGCRVIYHIHETTMKPMILKKTLFRIVRWAADDVIYVSRYLAETEHIPGKRVHVLYNAIENDFLKKARTNQKTNTIPGHVLMVCSLKTYKGVFEFVRLAVENQDYSFRLVLNAALPEIKDFFSNSSLPENLELFPTQTNLHPFYYWADVVLNLSTPDTWVETFGLTIIEGMAYGLPAIVPEIGGITELVAEGKNGYKVDSRNPEKLNFTLNKMMLDKDHYLKMSHFSKVKIEVYSEDELIRKSLQILN